MPASRSSWGRRPCQVPKFRSDRPRAWGEYAGIICTPNSFSALPTCVKRCLSTGSPAFGVTKKWLARSLYNAQNTPCLSITSRKPAITVRVTLLPPTARNRFRWSRRPESRSGHTAGCSETSNACCRQCAAASLPSAGAAAFCDASPLAAFDHQARSLQRLLHPGVAQLNAVFLLQLFVEMPYLQVVVPLAVQAHHLLAQFQRHSLGTHHPFAPVSQPVIPVLFQTLPPAPHAACADPDDLRRLPPADLFRHGSQQHFLHLHQPIHLRVRICSAGFQLPASRYSSAFLKADRPCVN